MAEAQSKELVCDNIGEMLNELLEQDTEKLMWVARYERNEACQDYRSGKPSITSGDVTLHKFELWTDEVAISTQCNNGGKVDLSHIEIDN